MLGMFIRFSGIYLFALENYEQLVYKNMFIKIYLKLDEHSDF